jgi:hypothetical protein
VSEHPAASCEECVVLRGRRSVEEEVWAGGAERWKGSCDYTKLRKLHEQQLQHALAAIPAGKESYTRLLQQTPPVQQQACVHASKAPRPSLHMHSLPLVRMCLIIGLSAQQGACGCLYSQNSLHPNTPTLACVDDLCILADVVAAQVGSNGVRHLASCQVGVTQLAPHGVLVDLRRHRTNRQCFQNVWRQCSTLALASKPRAHKVPAA